eukprot:TRINITY_DN7626_c0_g1_i4.p1 TRINITY_DN7626_c0_g1~~TRINITY_DN7626_c0_g1_i4.p1  ORF type:complete len:199 (+),score=17.91 TRINITY_DN7626_c0_g1_i4:298-894(+)
MSAADGPAFLAAAVSAAIRAKAPRRTVQAVAAAVASVFVRPATTRATPRTRAAEPAGAQGRACEEDGDAAVLLDTLRAARSAQRRRKKERRRAAKAAAASESRDLQGAADQDVGTGEAHVDVSALAPGASHAEPLPTPMQGSLHLQPLPTDHASQARSNMSLAPSAASARSFSIASSSAARRAASGNAVGVQKKLRRN